MGISSFRRPKSKARALLHQIRVIDYWDMICRVYNIINGRSAHVNKISFVCLPVARAVCSCFVHNFSSRSIFALNLS